jgi:hypothetical protein
MKANRPIKTSEGTEQRKNRKETRTPTPCAQGGANRETGESKSAGESAAAPMIASAAESVKPMQNNPWRKPQ